MGTVGARDSHRGSGETPGSGQAKTAFHGPQALPLHEPPDPPEPWYPGPGNKGTDVTSLLPAWAGDPQGPLEGTPGGGGTQASCGRQQDLGHNWQKTKELLKAAGRAGLLTGPPHSPTLTPRRLEPGGRCFRGLWPNRSYLAGVQIITKPQPGTGGSAGPQRPLFCQQQNQSRPKMPKQGPPPTALAGDN